MLQAWKRRSMRGLPSRPRRLLPRRTERQAGSQKAPPEKGQPFASRFGGGQVHEMSEGNSDPATAGRGWRQCRKGALMPLPRALRTLLRPDVSGSMPLTAATRFARVASDVCPARCLFRGVRKGRQLTDVPRIVLNYYGSFQICGDL